MLFEITVTENCRAMKPQGNRNRVRRALHEVLKLKFHPSIYSLFCAKSSGIQTSKPRIISSHSIQTKSIIDYWLVGKEKKSGIYWAPGSSNRNTASLHFPEQPSAGCVSREGRGATSPVSVMDNVEGKQGDTGPWKLHLPEQACSESYTVSKPYKWTHNEVNDSNKWGMILMTLPLHFDFVCLYLCVYLSIYNNGKKREPSNNLRMFTNGYTVFVCQQHR